MFSVMKLTEIVLALRNRDTVLQTIKCKKNVSVWKPVICDFCPLFKEN